MKKILIVSGIPYSQTNRGIDTITTYFMENNYSVEHLVFGVTRKKKISELEKFKIERQYFRQLYNLPSFLPNRFLSIFPFLLPLYIHEKLRSIRHINFEKYDLIVLESGFPLLLLDKVKKTSKLIIRISDPILTSFGKERDIYKKLEEKAIKKSNLTLIAHEKILEYYKNKFQDKKIFLWKTGFNIPKKYQELKSIEKSKKVIYMGLYELDYSLLKNMANEFKNYDFYIIGPYKAQKIAKNIIFTGYLDAKEYLKILAESICFFIPYSKKTVNNIKDIGMTSKFYLAMFYGKPILTKKYGSILQDEEEFNIYTYNNFNEAKEKFKFIEGNNFNKNEKITMMLEELKIENRKKELEELLFKI